MKKCNLKLLLFCLFWCSNTYSQVNLPGGSAVFDLPIFTWHDNKSRLNTGVSVSYSSGSGLLVNSVASDLGQGWNLNQGGVITRIQAGEPDDQKPYEGNGASEDITKYPAGYLYDNPPAPGYSNTISKYPIYKDKNHIYKQHNNVAADKQLDQFAFTFNGRSGIFILGKADSVLAAPVFIGDTKLKAWYDIDESLLQQGIRTTITAFYIMDEQGLVYTFRRKELTKVLKTVYTGKDGIAKLTQPKFESGKVYYEKSVEGTNNEIYRPYVVTAWYLEQITDRPTGRHIDFTYDTKNIQAEAGTSFSYYSKNYSIATHSISYTTTPKITQIHLPDGHDIDFSYGAERIDLTGDRILTAISVKYKGRYLSRYNFKTTYVIRNRYGSPVTPFEKNSARLYLLSISKMGPDLRAEDNPYHFDYYLGSSLPYDFVPPPFYHLRDIWGYYNGNNSMNSGGTPIDPNKSDFDLTNQDIKGICYLRDGNPSIVLNAKDGWAKNGLLHQITFPAGGSLNYDYEQNMAMLNGQLTSVGGVHVSRTTMTDGGYSNSCNNPISTIYNYTLEDGVQPSYWGVEYPVNSITFQNYYKPEKKRFSVWSLSCHYQYKFPGIMSRENSISLTSSQKTLQVISDLFNVAGPALQIIDIIQFASGTTGPLAIIIDAITTVINFVFTCFSDPSETTSMTIYYNSDLNATNPLPSQFKRVEVIQGSGSIGKTVQEFTSTDDYPVWYPTNPAYSMKQRFAYWAYGLPKRTAVYDSTGNILEETTNLYDTTYAKRLILCRNTDTVHTITSFPTMARVALPAATQCDSPYISYKNLILRNSSQRSDRWDDPNYFNSLDYTSDLTSNPDMKVDKYYAFTGRMLLSKTVKKVFKKGHTDQYQLTTTEYSYNNADQDYTTNYEINQIKTIQSNGDINYQTFRYDNQALNDFFITTTPFETTTSFQKAGSATRYYTSEKVTAYMMMGTPYYINVLPYSTLEQRFASPVPASAMNFWNSTTNPVYATTQTFTYDSYGNKIGYSDEGGRNVTQLFDPDGNFVVASVINAVPGSDKVAYTSFESADLNLSGWACNTSFTPNINASVTGKSCLSISAGTTLSAAMNSQKSYTLSFWATSGLTVSGGASLVKSAPTINGFTYYEYRITQGTASVSITGSGNIDELRLFPSNARMETTSYDPVLGRTSSCDQNNRITYYEYDELGRLRFIKDEARNIVKMYEYNQKANVNSCNAVFQNLAVNEIFTKNDCPAGFKGSEVTFTIPAGKYTSTISQEDVDAKVEVDISTNGQSFANANGTCIQVFTNDAMSQTFTREGCDDGYKGTSAIYTVPAGKYSSTVSKADANNMAQIEIDANGQAFANTPGNASCIADTTPDFEAEEDAPTQCQQSGGTNTGHVLVLATDVNPHSATYNQTQWADMGVNNTVCPVPVVIYARLDKENIVDYPFEQYADFVVRFYSDYNCTIPLNVTNLQVNLSFTVYDNYFHINQTTNSTVTCSGTEYWVATNVQTYYNYVQDYDYNAWYDLRPGAYVIR